MRFLSFSFSSLCLCVLLCTLLDKIAEQQCVLYQSGREQPSLVGNDSAGNATTFTQRELEIMGDRGVPSVYKTFHAFQCVMMVFKKGLPCVLYSPPNRFPDSLLTLRVRAGGWVGALPPAIINTIGVYMLCAVD